MPAMPPSTATKLIQAVRVEARSPSATTGLLADGGAGSITTGPHDVPGSGARQASVVDDLGTVDEHMVDAVGLAVQAPRASRKVVADLDRPGGHGHRVDHDDVGVIAGRQPAS